MKFRKELPMIQIKHRYTNAVLCEFEVDTIKEAVELAIKSGSDLRYSDLRYSNLRGSDLSGSNLRGSDLRYSDLRGSNLRGSDLSGSNLRGSNLRYSDLRGSNLSYSDLSYSDLSYSDLSGSNLRYSDLRYSNLRGSNLSGEILAIQPIFISGIDWDICITESYLKIGCERHTHDEWKEFNDEAISEMHGKALEFWKANKSWILSACKAHRKQSLAYRKEIKD